MIAKLKGRVDFIGDSFVILDVAGVGYQALCSRQTLSMLSSGEEGIVLWIETVMRAEQLTLYGFATFEEQECFRLLNTVQGVGGRMALSLLSIADPSRLIQAIADQDGTFLTQADGVGPKLANRVVQELKDKVAKIGRGVFEGGPLKGNTSEVKMEALSALMNLGYRRNEALEALSRVHTENPSASLEMLIAQSLKRLSNLSERLSS